MSKEAKRMNSQILATVRKFQILAQNYPAIYERLMLQHSAEQLDRTIKDQLKLPDLASSCAGRPRRRDGEEKLAAAKQAHLLLSLFAKKSDIDRVLATTRGSVFCKLSAALLGKNNADLQIFCRRVKAQVS